MVRKQGFLVYDEANKRYFIDYQQSLSIAANELLLELLLAAQPYMRGRLLDVGCGKRPYALIYERHVELSIGTEVQFSLHGTAAADLIGYAEELPFADASFDTILCTEVLEHTRHPFQVLTELARLLKPGGHLILSTPFIYPIHEAPRDYWRFTVYGLQKICQDNGLDIVEINSKGGVITTMMILTHNIAVRIMNVFSKICRIDPPLYERKWARWCICLPRWVYLALSRTLRYRIHHLTRSENVANQLDRLLKRNNTLAEINHWLACGYICIARKPVDI